ncbi:MAG: division/cell wall cluster transcriptional repressor MraZ [Clostridiales bacterium]|nr:division/cell wall cluster transcriptional repressor MraZ [Clostridiales bacterium]MBR2223989.1 division/cell wall cluster transcriptional repressor MraZ [Christensenellaceae bacterium]MBR3843811.1 division/cell wall cluster transcriptional repressor MraZ [Christensenellaceae bacterium]
MLLGEFQHSVDKKGRVFMPAKLREELGEKFIATRGIGKCLFVFPMDMWNELYEKLRQLPLTDKGAQQFTRMLFASATECEPDKQGRILLPQRLREYAGIDEEATVIGVMTRVEIWSPENWSEYNNGSEDDFDDTLANLAGRGI